MIPLKTIEELIKKHSSLEKDLSSGKIDKNFFAVKSKEYADLNEVIQDAKKYFSYEKERLEIQKILDDKNSDSELLKMAEVELNDLKLENSMIFILSGIPNFVKIQKKINGKRRIRVFSAINFKNYN